MEYSIKEIAGIIGADAPKLYDAPVSILLTDSRRLSFPEQSLFFALQTKTNDGHNYIQGLYKLRVRNFVVSTFLPEFESMPEANFLVVKDTLKALQKLAAHHRKRFNIPVIGITGSNGKTIVKEFLYQLLHNEFNIVRSPRSYNSQLGVPLSVWQMSDKNTLGIFEAGISQPDRLGSPFVYRIDQETGFRNHYPLHAFRFRPDIHDSFYGRRFYRKRHPLYGRDVVSETDKRKRYRKIQAPRTGCHALGRKAGYQQLPIDKRHL